MFVKEYCPAADVKADAIMSSEGDKRSTFTLEGPPVLTEQLSPPTAPMTFPDIMNLHENKIPVGQKWPTNKA